MTTSTRGLLIPYLAVVVAGLCYLNWWQANKDIAISPIGPGSIDVASDTGNKPAAVPTRRVPALSDLSETITRPVFRSDRRLLIAKPIKVAAPSAQEPPQPQASVDTLRLVGMMRTGTSQRRALIRVAGVANAEWVEVGATIAGWTIAKIEKDGVEVNRNGEAGELKLFAPRAASPAATPDEPDRKAP